MFAVLRLNSSEVNVISHVSRDIIGCRLITIKSWIENLIETHLTKQKPLGIRLLSDKKGVEPLAVIAIIIPR